VLEVFEEVRIKDRGGDLVVARGPLAEIDDAAAVRAEGEVRMGGLDESFAGGTFEGGGHGRGSWEDDSEALRGFPAQEEKSRQTIDLFY
jgi:hypothetical protein